MNRITAAKTTGTKLIKVETVPEKFPTAIIVSVIKRPTTPTTTPITIKVMLSILAIFSHPPLKL